MRLILENRREVIEYIELLVGCGSKIVLEQEGFSWNREKKAG